MSRSQFARDVMTREPARCSRHATLDEVAALMVTHDCGAIPVVDVGDRPIGMITDRDIACRVVANTKNPVAYPVTSCMSQPVVTVREETAIDEVIAAMRSHAIKRVVVVDDDGCCVGLVAVADLVRNGEPADLAGLLRELSRPHAATRREQTA